MDNTMNNTSNKIENLSFGLVSQSGIVVPSVIDKKTSKKYVNWGEDNKLPDYLWDSYLKCSNLQAIINTIKDYIIGEGIEYTDLNISNIEKNIQKWVMDYIIFGGFAIECLRNMRGQICRMNYINVMNIRVNEDLDTAYLSNNWQQWSGKDVITLPLYNEDEQQDHFIYYYRGDLTRNINPIPMYIGALKSVEILNQTRNFHLNNLQNNFSVNAIINLNNGNIKKRELEEIKEQLEDNYCGSNNAGKFLLINGGDKEHAATVERLVSDQFGDLYSSLQESSVNDLFVAFRINPMLLGVNVQTGFSRQEFNDAYALFDKTVISQLKANIASVFSDLGIEIEFKPIKIQFSE